MLRNGIEIFPAMIDQIDAAEHTVDLVDEMNTAGCDVRWLRPVEDREHADKRFTQVARESEYASLLGAGIDMKAAGVVGGWL